MEDKKIEINARGFAGFQPISTRTSGMIKVQQSSAVAPSAWIHIDKDYVDKHHDFSLHLRYEEVEALVDRLQQYMAYTREVYGVEEDQND